jgi:hypothetical protein
MKIISANFKKPMAALVVIVVAVVGTYAIRSALHRHSPAVADAHKGELVGVAYAAAPPQEASKPTPSPVVGGGQYSPYVGESFPNRVYWGVAHVHTGYSFDAGMFGITLTPDDLFRVARGGEVVMDNGVRFKQDRPLDWVAITDHLNLVGYPAVLLRFHRQSLEAGRFTRHLHRHGGTHRHGPVLAPLVSLFFAVDDSHYLPSEQMDHHESFLGEFLDSLSSVDTPVLYDHVQFL